MTTSSTALTNVRVFTGAHLTHPRTVVIADGRIADAETASAATTVDGKGGALLPGLIDCHIHLDGIDNLRDAAHWGVTTMLDMGTSSPRLVDSLRNRPGLTDIRSAESPASAPGGTQTTKMGMPPSSVVTGPDDAERFVAERVAQGADYIKIIIENPAIMGAALSGPTIAAIVQAAHRHHLRTIAHVASTAAFHLGTDAHVDILTHAPLDAPLSAALVDAIVAGGILAVPTLVMMRGIANRRQMPTTPGVPGYHNAEISVTQLHHAGVPVLAGTDANTAPASPCQLTHGESLHDELALLVAAGLTPVDALRGATVLAARHFDLEDRGAIAPGRRADLLLIDGDPTTDIGTTRAIQGVWIAGERVR